MKKVAYDRVKELVLRIAQCFGPIAHGKIPATKKVGELTYKTIFEVSM